MPKNHSRNISYYFNHHYPHWRMKQRTGKWSFGWHRNNKILAFIKQLFTILLLDSKGKKKNPYTPHHLKAMHMPCFSTISNIWHYPDMNSHFLIFYKLHFHSLHKLPTGIQKFLHSPQNTKYDASGPKWYKATSSQCKCSCILINSKEDIEKNN